MADTSRAVDEEVRREFERARLAGDTRPLEDFLPKPSHPRYAATLEELVLIETEFLLRSSREEALGLETWIERFPILGESETRQRLREEWPALLNSSSTAEPSRAGRYELVEEIGGGTFARVFRAWDPKLRREVAVKLLRAQYVADERTVQRFRREARSAANLQHPDILPIYEVGDEAGVPFLVGLLVEGPTLEQRLREAQPTARTAAAWLARLCDALDYAHRLGVIHRDVKPENVLTTPEGELKLADFGLARLDEGDSSLTRDGDLLGTPAYMSPEQARGDEFVDERTDVYSLGVILYRCLTGCLPFEGGWSAVLRRVAEESPLPPSRRASGVPADLETICMTAMAREREGRYPSAAAMGADLRAFLNHQSIRARRPSLLESVSLWCRREPRVAITSGVALVLLLLVAGLGLRGVLTERDRFRQERDVAQANLYRALIGEARAKLEAGTGAWWWEGMDRIRRARALQKETGGQGEAALASERELRDLAVEFVGTRAACLREVTLLESGESAVRSLAIDAAAKRFAVGRADGTVTVHALPSGETLLRASVTDEVLGLAFHPRGHLLSAVAANGVLEFFDVSLDSTAETLVEPAFAIDLELPLSAAACSRVDGRLALACEDGRLMSLREWRPDAERELLASHTSAAEALRFASDGLTLASVHEDLDMFAWDVESGKLVDSLSTGDRITGIDIDDLGRIYGSVYPWYSFVVFKQGDLWRPTTMHSRPTTALRLAGRWIFSGAEDGELKAWTPARVEAASARSIASRLDVLETDAEGHYLLAGHVDGGVCLWEFRQANERRYLTRAHDLDFLSDRRLYIEGNVLEFDAAFQMEGRPLDARGTASLALVGTSGEFLCGGRDGRLWLLDASGEIVAEWPAHGEEIVALAVESSGRRVASISSHGELKLWTLEGRRELARLALEIPAPRSAEWHEAGERLLLSGAEQSALVHWDGNELRFELLAQPGPACFAGGGVAFGSERGEVHYVDSAATGPPRLLGDVRESILNLIWNEKRGELLVATLSGAVHACDLATETWKRKWKSEIEAPAWFAFDDQSRFLLVGGSKTFPPSVFDYESTEALTWLQQGGLGSPAYSVATEEFLFPAVSGGALALSIEDIETFVNEHPTTSGDATVRRYDRLRTRFAGAHTSVVWGNAVSSDSRYLATVCHSGVVKVWEGSDLPKLLWSRDAHAGPAWSVAFDPRGERLVSTSLTVKLWSVESGVELMTLDGHGALVTCAAFLGNGERLLTGSLDGDLCLWDLATGELLGRPLAGDVPIHDLEIDPSGRWLVVALHDDRLAIWDRLEEGDPMRGPDLVRATEAGAPWALGFDRTGQTLGVASEGGAVSLWNVAEWKTMVALRGESRLLRSISFSEDGQLVAAGCYGTNAIIWDLTRVRELLRELDLDWGEEK